MTSRRRTLVAAVLAVTAWGPAVGASASPAEDVEAQASDSRVLLVSVDGLNPKALTRLGVEGTPNLHRLVAEGASTMNARTLVEQTETLPNHIGMVTGRRIHARYGGHGVTWNDERRRPRTVHRAAGERVASIFSWARTNGRSSALFAAKPKFTLMTRSWRAGIDRTVIEDDNVRLVRRLRRDLAAHRHDVTMLHLSLPDVAGHAHGFMSAPYLEAVRITDRLLGKVLTDLDVDTTDRTWIVLTADHGGAPRHHRHTDVTALADYRVPFVVWGPDVRAGGDLYELSPGLADPGVGRPRYRGPQPVRNGAAANVVAGLLGLPPVPGSRIDRDRALRWR